ncbi:hypothetical protein TSUD_377680 [Trifolium subterraneum]|uniref:G domain-containing protein n=1 Tax=Trifolium subterraneum TaxID=3900 RepID=A0A2Z6NI31_TRISU|nr:hypothetical protein TSUD_377680 [Trifolium subterraneum]
MFHRATIGRFSSWSSLPRILYYTVCSSTAPSSPAASTFHLRHFSAESVERLRHVWISGLIDPNKVGPTERSMLYVGKIDEMHASLNKEQPVQEFDTIRAGITFLKWKDHKITVMDTPGRVDDITDEVETALGAFDSGIHVLSKVPADMEALVEEKRHELIENVAPLDDKLAKAFNLKKPISPTDLKEAVRRATITRRFIPVFMGSAFKYKTRYVLFVSLTLILA